MFKAKFIVLIKHRYTLIVAIQMIFPLYIYALLLKTNKEIKAIRQEVKLLI